VKNIHSKELNRFIEDKISGLFARIEGNTLGFDTMFACYCLQWFLTLYLFGFSIAMCLQVEAQAMQGYEHVYWTRFIIAFMT